MYNNKLQKSFILRRLTMSATFFVSRTIGLLNILNIATNGSLFFFFFWNCILPNTVILQTPLTFLLGDKSTVLCVPTPMLVPAISTQFRLPFGSISSTKTLTWTRWYICGAFRSFTLYLDKHMVKWVNEWVSDEVMNAKWVRVIEQVTNK